MHREIEHVTVAFSTYSQLFSISEDPSDLKNRNPDLHYPKNVDGEDLKADYKAFSNFRED